MDKIKGFFVEFKSVFSGDNVIKENEEHANVVTATVMMNIFFIAVIICALRIAGLFDVDLGKMITVTIISFFIMLVPAVICFIRGGKGKYLKNILLVLLSTAIMLIYSILTYTATLLIVIPVILAARYYQRKFTEGVALVSVILLGFASYAGIKWGLLDINYIVIPEGTQIIVGNTLTDSVKELGLPEIGIVKDIMLQSYLPVLLLYVFIISFACIQVSQSGRKMIEKQKELSEKGARIQAELNLATRIQADMIPQLFPAFPDRTEFDLYASMTPAKEVGGDFYDFFMVDDDHLGLVIADVSGKGVPAALFMMASKSIIQNNAMLGKSPAEVLRDTNNSICVNNREEMFVTVWLGILEISTGKLTCANAGHEYPVLCSPDGTFELYKDKHGFVIGGMADMNYKEYEIMLKPGSKLFVYTDGVPEATDAENELFGTDRMIIALNSDKAASPQQILANVRSSVDSFVKDAEQFDDITMLCLEYKGVHKNADKITVEANKENLQKVTEFVDEILEKAECSMKAQMQLDVAIEELFVNIAGYAYPSGDGTVSVKVEVKDEPKTAVITFTDAGIPYDPLAKEDPDVTLSAEERDIGGLGIFLVKKSMDDMCYEFKDGKNILTITKNIQ